jgi:ketosteroid isomerase-like protein
VSANLDLVRSIYSAWERGDWSAVTWADPAIEFVAADGPDPSASTGIAAMAERWRECIGAWAGYRAEPEECRELDSERVLVFMRHGGRGKASGMGVEQLDRRGANIFHIRDGRVTRLSLYWDRERALADLGLEDAAFKAVTLED